MTPLIVAYTAYLVITVAIMLFVAHTLRKHGLPILSEGQEQRRPLVDAWLSLILIGFRLATLGMISYTLAINVTVTNAAQVMEVLSRKIGFIVIIIAVVHVSVTVLFTMLRRPQPHKHEELSL